MGASDPYLFPQYIHYISENLANTTKNLKKVGWLGLQQPYYVSDYLESFHSEIETHCFDIVPQEGVPRCHRLDLNETGWGSRLREEGFNLLTLLRCTCYIKDQDAAIRELRDFLGEDGNRLIWFEDMDPNDYLLSETANYCGVAATKTQCPFGHALLSEHFLIMSTARLRDEYWAWYDQYLLARK